MQCVDLYVDGVLVLKMLCETMRAKVCDKIENCKGLALVKTYLDALVKCELRNITWRL